MVYTGIFDAEFLALSDGIICRMIGLHYGQKMTSSFLPKKSIFWPSNKKINSTIECKKILDNFGPLTSP
jgi:hypothetical protein